MGQEVKDLAQGHTASKWAHVRLEARSNTKIHAPSPMAPLQYNVVGKEF